MRDAVPGPLVADHPDESRRVRHSYFTHRTMQRLRTSRSMASSLFSLVSSVLRLRSRSSSSWTLSPRPPAAAPFRRARETQLAKVGLVDPQLPRDLRERLARLGHDSHSPLTELRVELPPLLRHDSQLPLQSRPLRYEGKVMGAFSDSR